MKPALPPASMVGTSSNGGGGGDTQVLDGGTPPLGSPVSDSDSDVTRSDDGGLYEETQPVDEAETQLVDGVDEEEEEDEDVAGDWGETQLVESGEEDDCDDDDQVKMQLEVEDEDDGGRGGGAEDNAGNWTRTQLVQECEVEDGGNNGVGGMVETQVVEDSEEEEEDGVNGGDELCVDEWGKTQLVEHSDEEIGDDELSDSTQVLSDNESLSGDERDAKSGMDKMDVELGMEGNIEWLNGGVEKLGGGDENLVDSDASTDEECDTGSGHIQIKLPSVRVASVRTCGISEARDTMSVNGMQQGKQKFSSSAIHPLPKIVDESTLFSTSFGGNDNDSCGYVQNHDKDGTKSRDKCSTAKKLFADTTAEDGENNIRCLAGLSYIGSQEPGDLSQANAFDVVDRLISINGGLSSQETTPNKLEMTKPRVSTKRGTLMLAEKVDIGRSSNGKAEIFEWVDSREDDGGGDFFSKNKDILLQKPAGRGKQKSHSTGAKMSSKNLRRENKIGESKNKRSLKLTGRSETLPCPDSRLLKSDVKSKQASGNRTKKNLFKDLDDLSNGNSLEEEQEKADAALHDVGPDTQMAVEAMEALVQCSPAKGQPLSDRDTRAEKSRIAKSHSKNGSPQKRTSNIQEGVTTRSKRRKVTASNTNLQKEKMQENSERIVKIKRKQTKSVPLKSKVSKKFIDENKYHGTPVAHRTRHCGRNDPSEFAELCSNKQSKRGKTLTGDGSTVGEVPKKHIKNNLEKPLISERTTGSGSSHFEKESAEHTCANDDQDLQQSRNGSTQRTGVNNVQNLVACRVEPTTDILCRGSPSHPKQRRTATAMVQSKPTTAAKHEIPAELARPTKKRRIFVRSVSDLLKYAKREPSNGRSASILSSIMASPILNSSVRHDGKTSDLSSSAQRLKEPSHVEDTSKSPKSKAQVQNSVMRTPSKVVKELSPTFSPVNPSTGSNRSLSKSSVARELLKLDPESALSNQQRKDSRRRKDMAAVSILFSHHLDDDVIKRQKKILARLGVCEAFSMADATHFVADSFFRTRNMLEAITLGKPVVTSMWLENCGQAGCFIDERKYILRDAKKEKELGFSMPISLASAVKHPLLLGKRVFVTLNVKPSQVVVTSLVKASSGQPLERVGRSIMKGNEVPDDLLVISCEEDYQTCAPLLEKGAIIFSTELLLNGIVIQKLEYERHHLFTDRVKQTRSSRWLKDTAHDRFVHVPKLPCS